MVAYGSVRTKYLQDLQIFVSERVFFTYIMNVLLTDYRLIIHLHGDMFYWIGFLPYTREPNTLFTRCSLLFMCKKPLSVSLSFGSDGCEHLLSYTGIIAVRGIVETEFG